MCALNIFRWSIESRVLSYISSWGLWTLARLILSWSYGYRVSLSGGVVAPWSTTHQFVWWFLGICWQDYITHCAFFSCQPCNCLHIQCCIHLLLCAHFFLSLRLSILRPHFPILMPQFILSSSSFVPLFPLAILFVYSFILWTCVLRSMGVFPSSWVV